MQDNCSGQLKHKYPKEVEGMQHNSNLIRFKTWRHSQFRKYIQTRKRHTLQPASWPGTLCCCVCCCPLWPRQCGRWWTSQPAGWTRKCCLILLKMLLVKLQNLKYFSPIPPNVQLEFWCSCSGQTHASDNSGSCGITHKPSCLTFASRTGWVNICFFLP